MKEILIIVAVVAFASTSLGQKRPYVIYNSKGKKVSYKKMLKSLSKKELILFGEQHNNAIAHWLQFELTTDLHKRRKLVLGAEMFEADNQEPLNEYLKGAIDAKQLKEKARLWKNYKTDYAPLVDFAKEKKLPFVATNIPRKYANLVYKKGFGALDSLSAQEKGWMAPLPIPFDSELPTYKAFLVSLGDHGSPELIKAQAIKDATMAHFILRNYKAGHLFLHFNGSGHSDSYEGILWYVKQERKEINAGVISTVTQKNVNKLLKKNRKIADFIICVDENMTKTY